MGAHQHHDIFMHKLLDMQAKLYNFAFMLTSNRDDANDLLQDTTLKAMDSEDKYVDNVNFKGWVFTIGVQPFYQQLSPDGAQRNYDRPHRRPHTPESAAGFWI